MGIGRTVIKPQEGGRRARASASCPMKLQCTSESCRSKKIRDYRRNSRFSAVTSNGLSVGRTPGIPRTSMPSSRRPNACPQCPAVARPVPQMQNELVMWNDNVDAIGIDKWLAFLDSKVPTRELKQRGYAAAAQKQAHILVSGSLVMGPKIGGGSSATSRATSTA